MNIKAIINLVFIGTWIGFGLGVGLYVFVSTTILIQSLIKLLLI